MTDTLLDCHRRLAQLLGPTAEPVDVLRRAEEHRQFWRPEKVNVVLLAESHVYTSADELERDVAAPRTIRGDMPRGFVRLVYCLGYGENDLLSRPIAAPPNAGTPQYWQVFFSCANEVRASADFAPILKGGTPSLRARVGNKVALLERLRDLGVWLLDASPAALYVPGGAKGGGQETMDACLRAGWDYHVGPQLRAARPAHVICIGVGVGRALRGRLSTTRAEVTVVPQPNARLSAAEHWASFLTYHRVVRETSPRD